MRVLFVVVSILSIGFLLYLNALTPRQEAESFDVDLLAPTSTTIGERASWLKRFEQPREQVRDATEGQVKPITLPKSQPVERLPAVVPPPVKTPFKPVIWKGIDVIAAGIVKSASTIIHLGDIEPISIKKTCTDSTGKNWPCGQLAKTEFRQFVRRRSIKCGPPPEDSKTSNQDELVLRCKLGSTDMSAWLVANGWADPKGNNFENELKLAKTKQRGKWNLISPIP